MNKEHATGAIAISILLLMCISTLAAATGGNDSSCVFSGVVNRGEDFSIEFVSGMEFRLDFIDYQPEGWAIRIVDPAYPSENFCSVVTPPYSGVNALQIYDWHFLSENGSEPNDGSVNAPGEERNFFFVSGRDDFSLAFESLSGILWPESEEEAENAGELHESIPRRHGVMHITEIIYGTSEDEEKLWIESIAFNVELFSGLE